MKAAELCERLTEALSQAGEAEVEATASFERRGFARFAVGDLGQHMAIAEPSAAIRVARGSRVAEVAVASVEPAELSAAIARAALLAAEVPEDPHFPGFARDAGAIAEPPGRWFGSTAGASPSDRVARLAPVFDAIAGAGFHATGAFETSVRADAVVTSHGVRRIHDSTLASFRVWALESAGARGASGHGHATHPDVDALDLEAETRRAIEHAARGKNPVSFDPGAYDVVLEPAAVAELVEWLGFIAFGAEQLHQGSSPLSGRIGERLSGERLSIAEDPLGPFALVPPFDREGTARRRVDLIERGVGRGVVTDRGWAHRLGGESTGNAAAPTRFGQSEPTPAAMVVAGGEAADSDALIRQVQRGLHVCRLHYVNGMLEPRRAVMTGLTRDGTFAIENGAVTRAVRTLRFTDSLLEAFARCDGLTRRRTLCPNRWAESGSVAAPAVLLRGLRFTGGSAS